jgi:hypothetical protein
VVKGPLVRRGYIFDWREDCKAEGNKEEGGENLPNLYITPILLGVYNTCKCIGGNWI